MGPRSRHTAQEGDTFCLLEINFLDIGGAILIFDEKHSRFKQDTLSRKDARLCIFLTVLERKHSEVSESAKILSVSAPELILQAKPR